MIDGVSSGAYVRQVRLSKGLTVTQLARALRVVRTTIWRWENNRAIPTARMRSRLIRTLRLDVNAAMTLHSYYGWYDPYNGTSKARRADTGPVGYCIRKFRKRRGIQQQHLATALNVCKSALSRWETGARPLPVSVILKIGTILDIDQDERQLLAAAMLKSFYDDCDDSM